MNVLTLTAYSPRYEDRQRRTNKISARIGGECSKIEIRYTPEPFSYPRAMKIGAEAALKMPHWDWLIMLDADGIFVSMQIPPASGFGACSRYDQKKDEHEGELLVHADQWTHSSYFIVSRDLLEKGIGFYHENFEGYGWDDFDFRNNVMNGVILSYSDAKSVHLHHDERWPINPNNHALYLKRYEEIHK